MARGLPRARQEQRQGLFGDLVHRVIADVAHGDAVTRGRIHVDVVHPDAVASDDAAPGACVHDLRGEGLQSHDDAVGVAGECDHVVLGRALLDGKIGPGVGEDLALDVVVFVARIGDGDLPLRHSVSPVFPSDVGFLRPEKDV